jgi:S-adenosylmethionine synthetase
MSDIIITALSVPSPASQPLEIVERKGLGHPDTVCDALAEALSRSLCRYYLDAFGLILHHNVDKALLADGDFPGGPCCLRIQGQASAN